MKPRWMRNNYGCPDCGRTFTFEEVAKVMKRKPVWRGGVCIGETDEGFTCPHCNAHYAAEDFYAEQSEKWGHTPTLPEEREQEEISATQFDADVAEDDE